MATKGDDAAPKKKGGIMGVLLPVLVLTLVAAGGGWAIGSQITAAKGAAAPEAKAEAAPGTTAVRELAPIVTNLSAPEGSWVRLQAAVVYDKADTQKMDVLSPQITDDMMAFVKTLTVAQLQGAAGLQHLREDLNERAGLRSEGKVKDVVIEMLVIE